LKEKVLIVYDISEDEVRDEVRDYLKNMGGRWLQYSVFELELEQDLLEEVAGVLRRILRKGTGDIRILRPCKRCYTEITHITTRRRDLTEWKPPRII